MAHLKIKLAPLQDILIPARSANILIDSANGDAALLYIYILSHGGELDTDAAQKRMSLSAERISAALLLLEQKGLIGKTEAPPIPERSDKTPEYSQQDVAEHMGSDKTFRELCLFAEETLGKILSTVDLQVLLGIYSWLGLPADVICLLITSCLEETKKKYGEGRRPTLRAIESRAKVWVRNGIMTIGLAEEYIKIQEKLGEQKIVIAEKCGISGRALSPSEERYISEWISLGISDELIAAAYDKTVINTGSLRWSYMNKILTTWNSLGYKTVADTEREATPSESANADEAAALKLRELNRKKREQNKEKI